MIIKIADAFLERMKELTHSVEAKKESFGETEVPLFHGQKLWLTISLGLLIMKDVGSFCVLPKHESYL